MANNNYTFQANLSDLQTDKSHQTIVKKLQEQYYGTDIYDPDYQISDTNLRKKKEKSMDEMKPQKILKKIGMQDSNFVVYEKLGTNGKVHRNFVSMDIDGEQSTHTLLNKANKSKSSRQFQTS